MKISRSIFLIVALAATSLFAEENQVITSTAKTEELNVEKALVPEVQIVKNKENSVTAPLSEIDQLKAESKKLKVAAQSPEILESPVAMQSTESEVQENLVSSVSSEVEINVISQKQGRELIRASLQEDRNTLRKELMAYQSNLKKLYRSTKYTEEELTELQEKVKETQLKLGEINKRLRKLR